VESTVTKHDVIGHLRQLIGGARARDIPVLYAPMAYTAETPPTRICSGAPASTASCSNDRCSSPGRGVRTFPRSFGRLRVRSC
jgi:hypothetical protein